MKFRNLFVGGTIVTVVFVIGWIANIVQVIQTSSSPLLMEITAFWVVKVIAIFVFPLGAVLGWIGMFI